jgi:hypothetical protein
MVVPILVISRSYSSTLTGSKGQIQLRVDGNSVINVDGLTLRSSEAGKIKGMHFQTFFGGMLQIFLFLPKIKFLVGHGEDWASPKDQRAWFADITGTIVR